MKVDVLDLLDLPDPRPMNRDLEEWASEQDDASQAGTEAGAPVARGPCKACGRPADATCLDCGDAICSRHQRVMYGLCLRCSPDDEEDGDDDEDRPDLDIPWIG